MMAPPTTTTTNDAGIAKPTETPRTPVRDRAPETTNVLSTESSNEDTGKKTRGSSDNSPEETFTKTGFSSPPSNEQTPFLAYARRKRSFSTPFQSNRSRYLLSFADAATAEEWWMLMRSEYGDTVQRESPQLYSFKNDNVPGKAWEDAKFAHLKTRWSYRKIEDAAAAATETKREDRRVVAALRRRGSAMARTPSMPVLREAGNGLVVGNGLLEDPFAPDIISTSSLADKTDFAQLNITSDRIQKVVCQSTMQLDALLEGQQAGAKGMQKLFSTMEQMSRQISALTLKQQEQESTLQTLLHQQKDSSQETQETQTAAITAAIQSSLQKTSQQIIKTITTKNDDSSSRKTPTATATTTPETLTSLQTSISQTNTAITSLLHNVSTSTSTTQKQLKSLTSLATETSQSQHQLSAQIKQTNTLASQSTALTTRLLEAQETGFEKVENKIEKQMVQMRNMFAKQEDGIKGFVREVVGRERERERDLAGLVGVKGKHCEVLAPPRKVNRKLVGYVYEKE